MTDRQGFDPDILADATPPADGTASAAIRWRHGIAVERAREAVDMANAARMALIGSVLSRSFDLSAGLAQLAEVAREHGLTPFTVDEVVATQKRRSARPD